MSFEDQAFFKLIPAAVMLILGVLEALGGLYINSKRTRNDFTIELVSTAILPTFVQPGIFLLVVFGMTELLPQWEDRFIDASIWLHFLAFLVFDDLTQYLWHRFSHVNKTMWKLHRPHHGVEEMGVLVTYRNAVLYYALMPGIWLSAMLVYMGMAYAYLIYIPVKLTVILLAHSETRWDRFLYRYKALSPLAWVIERIISTPSTHFAHHGLTAEDGVSHPNGNYGNLLFLWDVLFGTAKITRKYPERFGAWNRVNEPWYVQLFFPILRSKDERSELHSLRTKNDYDPSVDFKEFTR